MNTTTMRAAIAGGLLAALLGFTADQAAASYTAQVQGGTLTISGSAASDKLALRLAPTQPGTLQVDVGADGTADFSFDRSTFTAIDVDAAGGADEVRVDQSAGAFFDELLTIDGGGGGDTLLGGSGAETLLGGSGNDVVAGGDGDDVARLGAGTDVFAWHPGDDDDTVEGDAGTDVLEFHGSGIGESLGVAANGSHVRVLRNVANITMDLDDIERVALDPRGGADTIVVDDVGGTDLERADIDVSAFGGGGDGQPDSVIARGTDGDDSVDISSATGSVLVAGPSAQVHVTGSEAAFDSVGVATLAGADTITTAVGTAGPAEINADGGAGPDTANYRGTASDDTIGVTANGTEVRMYSTGSAQFDTAAVEDVRLLGLGGADTIAWAGGLPPAPIAFDGGAGSDTLRGGPGADVLLGGAGNDAVDGNQGADMALLGAGADVFTWDPGDGNDIVEGEAGTDLLEFHGNGAAETIDVSASGERAHVHRNIANITLDLDDVEGVAFEPLGGADTIGVGDLAGTDVTTVDVNLNAVGGSGDAQPDTVAVNGTEAADAVRVRRSGSQAIVRGLAAQTRVAGGEVAGDTLRIQTLGGDDQVTVGDIWDLITPIVDLGAGE